MSSADPFKGRVMAPAPPMRVLHRFTKPGGHWAEIRERTDVRIKQFIDGGWDLMTSEPTATS